MANAVIIEAFKNLFPLYEVRKFKRTGKNFMSFTLTNGIECVFEYYSPVDWNFRTMFNYKKGE